MLKRCIRINIAQKTVHVMHLASVSPSEMCDALNADMLGARVLTTGSRGDKKTSPTDEHRHDLTAQLMNVDSNVCRGILVVQVVIFTYAILADLFTNDEDSSSSAFLYCVVAALSHGLVRRSISAIFACRITIQVLMFLALIGALALGEYLEAATLGLAVSMSEWLVGCVQRGVDDALNKCSVGQPSHATKLGCGNSETVVPIEDVRPGDRLLLRAGEAIPVDGLILEESAFKVDEAIVTGEALPLLKQKGDTVHSGSVVTAGTAKVECMATVEDSFEGRIQRAVDEARGVHSRTDALVNWIVSWYTPCVVFGSIALAVATGEPMRGLAALVSSCPCALVVAASVVQACTVSQLLQYRVLVKSSHTLELLAYLTVVAVDKTGTLTNGQFELVDKKVIPGASTKSEAELLRLLAGLEFHDPHPLASSIVRAHTGCVSLLREGMALPNVNNFTRVESMGVWGIVENEVIGAGSLAFLDAMSIDLPTEAEDIRTGWEASGSAFTVVYMTIEDDVVMMLRLQDSMREDAAAAVEMLREAGIDIVMLTGDTEKAASAVAQKLDISAYRASCKPSDKQLWIEERKECNPSEVVGMLGDGLNDGPALAAADVGATISAGLQLTVDAADVVVEKEGPVLLHYARTLQVARWCDRIVRQNLVLVAVLKVATLILATTGHLTLTLGVLADTGGLLLVLGNSVRPLRWDYKTGL